MIPSPTSIPPSPYCRTGLASMKTRMDNGNKIITIRATVGVNDLTGIYKASAKFMGFGPRFNVKLGIDSIGCAFEVEQVSSPDCSIDC